MAEENQAATEGTQRKFAIQRIYTKDVSFETPNSPDIFTQEWRPKVDVSLNTTTKSLDNNHYELVLDITVTATQDDKTLYLAEVKQAGIFLIEGFGTQEFGQMLAIYCPNVLFPYAREAISDLVTRGSFPQFLLAPVNFEAAYAQQLKRQQEAQQEKPADAPAH